MIGSQVDNGRDQVRADKVLVGREAAVELERAEKDGVTLTFRQKFKKNIMIKISCLS